MKKTITINISGLVFNIEEDAFSALKNYLEKIGNKFNNLEERQEIIEDIEARIAELFTEKLNRNKEVINENDVSQIIEIMGSPDNFEGDETEPQEQTEKKSSSASNEKKKLFRDGDNKVVAGVCAGVSNYFGWNISVVRTLFALLILLGGTGFWLYIIAWIIIPEAKSVSEKLAMKGKNATVENIEKFVTKFKSDVRNFDTSNVTESFKNHSNKFNDFLVGTSKRINQSLKPKDKVKSVFQFIISLIGFILISFGIVIFISVFYSYFINPELFQDTEFMINLDSAMGVKGENYGILLLSFLLFVLSLAAGLIILGIRIAFNKNHDLQNKLSIVSKGSRFATVLSLITLIAFLIYNKMSYSTFSYVKNHELDFKNIIIKKLPNSTKYNGFSKLDFEIRAIDYEKPYLRIIDEGKGYNGYFLSSLKEDYMIQDSIISLPELINFRKGFYAKKKLKLILYVPAKDTINVINEFNDEKAY